jgi:selenophosphate synthase
VDELTVTLLADPQTSGGLVFGLAERHVDAALDALTTSGHRAARIGRASAGTGRLLLR